MSAPERREPQSEAALDSRPPSLRSLLSSLFFIPLRARSPPHTVPESSSPYQPRHPLPPRKGDRSLYFFLSQSDYPTPTLALTPTPSPVPVHGVCRISPSPTPPLPSCTVVIPSSSISLFLSRTPRVPTSIYYFYA